LLSKINKKKIVGYIFFKKPIYIKKFDLFYEYVNMLKGKLEFCQKLTKYEDNFELDESKLAEVNAAFNKII